MDEHRDGLFQDIADQTARSRKLRQDIAALAGKIAETEDEQARVHDDIVRDDISVTAADARGHAAQERRVAEHERQEQRRWSEVAEPGEQSAEE